MSSSLSFYEEQTSYKIQKYYSIKTVSEMLSVTDKHIRNMLKGKRMKGVRIGGAIRIPHSELVKAIKDY